MKNLLRFCIASSPDFMLRNETAHNQWKSVIKLLSAPIPHKSAHFRQSSLIDSHAGHISTLRFIGCKRNESNQSYSPKLLTVRSPSFYDSCPT